MSKKTDNFIATARDLIGTPFLHQGRSIEGLDCVGLVAYAAELAGLIEAGDLPAADYGRDPDGRLPWTLREFCRRVSPPETIEPGDLLMVRYTEDPQHLMIIEKVDYYGFAVIHAINPEGVIAHRIDSRWYASRRARLEGVYRIRDRAEREGNR